MSYKKYYVLAVAGQSNAVGYDESAYDEVLHYNRDESRLLQLGLYGDDNLKLIPLTWCAQNCQDMRVHNIAGGSGANYGTKGIHLPLAHIIHDYLPDDYGLIIVSVAYGGTGFTTTVSTATYNESTLRSDETDGTSGNGITSQGTCKASWVVDDLFHKMLRDRVKYALDLNKENKFLGVVWIQGEQDYSNASAHLSGFEALTSQLFTDWKAYANQSITGKIDKDIWYNVQSCSYWNTLSGYSTILSNYQAWNEKSYVACGGLATQNTNTNNNNGTGSTSSTLNSHYGNNAFYAGVADKVFNVIRAQTGLSLNVNNSKIRKLAVRGYLFDTSGYNSSKNWYATCTPIECEYNGITYSRTCTTAANANYPSGGIVKNMFVANSLEASQGGVAIGNGGILVWDEVSYDLFRPHMAQANVFERTQYTEGSSGNYYSLYNGTLTLKDEYAAIGYSAKWKPSSLEETFVLPILDRDGSLEGWYPVSDEARLEAETAYNSQKAQRGHVTYSVSNNDFIEYIQYNEVLNMLKKCETWQVNGVEKTEIDSDISNQRYIASDDRLSLTSEDGSVVISDIMQCVSILRGAINAKIGKEVV